MGLTKSSVGNNVLDDKLLSLNCDYTVAIARKSKCWEKHNF